MITFQQILNGDSGLSARSKINSVLAALVSGNEGINASWILLRALQDSLGTLAGKEEADIASVQEDIEGANNYTDKAVSKLYTYIDAMGGGVGGLVDSTSYDPSDLPTDKAITLIALGAGTFTNLKDVTNTPITISNANSVTVFYRAANVSYWNYKSMVISAPVMDQVPTSGNTDHVVSSDGIYKDGLKKLAQVGYYPTTISGGSVVVSVADAPDYVLTKGGGVRLKMLSAGTTASTLKIGNADAKDLWYNGAAVSAQNTWEANEIVSVFYDGTRFQASNSQGGGGQLKVSDAVADLDISDNYSNVLVRFSNGEIKTKNFDSSKIKVETGISDIADLDISDEQEYVLVRFQNGHIRTKNFDSSKSLISNLYRKKMCIIGDSYVANHQQSYTLTWHYLIAQENSMSYVNYGINGNGLVASGSPTIGTPVIDRYSEMDDDADYVIVVGGKNDYNKQLSIASFKTGLASICAGLIDKYVARGSKIAFFTPWNDYDSGTDPSSIKLIEYVDAIIEVCGKYSIPVFDSSRKSSMFMFNATFRTNYCQSSTDISHLNANGHKLFKNKAFNFLNQL